MEHWSIGRNILSRQSAVGWGARVIQRLADDLRRDFPEMTGLSARNLNYMRALAEAFPDVEIVQQVVARLSWGLLKAKISALNLEAEPYMSVARLLA